MLCANCVLNENIGAHIVCLIAQRSFHHALPLALRALNFLCTDMGANLHHRANLMRAQLRSERATLHCQRICRRSLGSSCWCCCFRPVSTVVQARLCLP